MTDPTLQLGRFAIPLETAMAWVRSYTDAAANRVSAHPYAYPAYDLFYAEQNVPDRLEDGDLLAPILLNVQISIRSFYGLQQLRDRLQAQLADDRLARPLAEWDPATIASVIGGLYAVLDEPDAKPWGISETRLSKVLHRKRPVAIALHDRWVRACYVGDGAPVPRARQRSSAEYMTLLSQAMATDLREQAPEFDALQEASTASPSLSNLRLLDILAWNAGQRSNAASRS